MDSSLLLIMSANWIGENRLEELKTKAQQNLRDLNNKLYILAKKIPYYQTDVILSRYISIYALETIDPKYKKKSLSVYDRGKKKEGFLCLFFLLYY